MVSVAKQFHATFFISVILLFYGTYLNWTLNIKRKLHVTISTRLDHLNQRCLELGKNHSFSVSEKALDRNFIWDRTWGVTYCKIPKAGTTFWIQNFARFSGVPKSILEHLNQDELHLLMKHIYRYST